MKFSSFVRFLLVSTLFVSFSLAHAQHDLAKPQNLSVAGNTLSWDAVTGATGYRLRWEVGRYRWFASVSASQTQYTFTGLTVGVTYEVWVRALGDGARYERAGPWSTVSSLTFGSTAIPTTTDTVTPTDTATATNTPTTTATATEAASMELAAPGNLRLVSGSTVTWDAVAGASGYRLRWGPPGDRVFDSVSASQTRYTLAGADGWCDL